MIEQRLFAALLFAGIATQWIPARWPYAVLQIALLLWAALRIRAFHRLHAILAAAAAWGLVQIAMQTTVFAHATLEKTLDWTTWLASAILAFTLFPNRESIARFGWWLAMFGGATAIAALVMRAVFETVWMGPFAYDNQYAAFIQLALPPALLGRRWPAAALSAVMIASVIVSGSVAGAALVLAETVAVLLLSGARRAFVAALAGLAVIAGIITGWAPLEKDLRREAPFELRRQLTAATLEMAADRPWTGFGLGTWSTVYPAYARFDDGVFDNQAHNDWAQWLAEGGVPFALLMAALAAVIAPSAVRGVWGTGLVFVLAHCFLEYHFQQRPAFGCLYFAVAGLSALPLSAATRAPAPAPAQPAPLSSAP